MTEKSTKTIINVEILAIRELEAAGKLSPSSADDAISRLVRDNKKQEEFLKNNTPIQSSTTSPTRG
jgi:hypothetical protein